MSVNSHGILQVAVVMIPGSCRPPPSMPKITVTEVGSSMSLHEEAVIWRNNGHEWSVSSVTVVLPVPMKHPPLVVTLWVNDSIVTRRLATLPRKGESLVSKVELVYPCFPSISDNDHGSVRKCRWTWVFFLGAGLLGWYSILLSVPLRSRHLSAHVMEPPMVVRRRLFIDEDSEQEQQSLRDQFYASETDPDVEDSAGEYSCESLVEGEETSTGSGTRSLDDAQESQWPEDAVDTDRISLHFDLDFHETHDLDPNPIRERDDLKVVDQSEDKDHSADDLAITAVTVIDCSRSHESNVHPEGATGETLVKTDDNNVDAHPRMTSIDMVKSTHSLPHGEGHDAFLISPSTLDESTGIRQEVKQDGDCSSDKGSSKSYVSTLPPDSDLVSEDPATDQQATTQAHIECYGHQPTRTHALPLNSLVTDNQPVDSTDNPGDHPECPSPSVHPRQHSPSSRSKKQGKRQRKKSRCTPTKGSKVQRVRRHRAADCDLDKPQYQDSPSVALIQVTQASSSTSRKRKVRPFSTSQIVPDWIPSKGLQTISNDFVEDTKWNIMDGPQATPLIPSIPVPKSINIRRSTRKRPAGNHSKA